VAEECSIRFVEKDGQGCLTKGNNTMSTPLKITAFLCFVLTAQFIVAQQAVAPLSPAPLLAIGKDPQDRPIPFGIPPYYSADTPLGSGPYKGVMATDPSLGEHVLYYPANIDAAAKLPIIAWGNGACIHAGNRFRGFLTEIASHGFLVISAGRMGHPSLEVGPQENPAVTPPGQPLPAPAAAAAQSNPALANDPSAPWRAMRSNADHLRQAIDWAIAENSRQGSRFFGKLDTTKIGVGGQSCGGGLATQVAADPRVTAVGMFNSGSRLTNATPQPGSNASPEEARKRAQAQLDAIHSPVLYLTGDEQRDIAFPGGRDSFEYLTKVPVIRIWEEGLAHIGTYGAPNGGSIGRIASNWYLWQLRGDKQAARMFTGADCILCREPTWHVQKKNIN
jgi:dienelactone hydrolase